MATTYDLGPAAGDMARLLAGVRDDQLGAPTPCREYTLGDLIDHVNGLSVGFEMAAAKTTPEGAGGPSGDASRLGDGWRERIAAQLDAMAKAWDDPGAWTGMTRIGGLELPAEIAGVVALDELVVHGWDIARATGQPYDPSAACLEPCGAMLKMAGGSNGFGAAVAVPESAPLLDHVIGLSGRDPSWSGT
ncbi:MAG TPA: TIGR03086 family metal-binding protein [Streptosporangiaceae bacterium]|jgi:uncharacterized protein (TIGR03086 family)